MKRYQIYYHQKGRSKPSYVITISKNGTYNGCTVAFCYQGFKYYSTIWKNDKMNGLQKMVEFIPVNSYFQNWRKGKIQGIGIYFKP